MLPQVCGSFPSVIPRARWCNLVRVECLQMIKKIVVAFILLEVDVTLGGGCGVGDTDTVQGK